MIGTTIGHYNIEEKLGEGGMGVVYKATDTKLDRAVALKFLPDHVIAGSDELARFVQEARAAAALNHPNICTIYGIEESEGKNFIVMEFVDGQMLSEKSSSLSMKQSIDIGIQIAEGLAAAHEKGIVHRDIKPENIMIRKDGIVQIMDFGLAKLQGASRLTKEGSTVGTAGYMSPEQVQGQDTDHRSDIFSLGVLLYEMLSGQPPFKGMHETAIAYEIVNVDSPPMSSLKPEILPELDAIVLDCLDKDPNERSQSAKQIAIDLKRYKRESSKSRVSRMTAARPAIRSDQTSRVPERAAELTKIQKYAPWSVAAAAVIALVIAFVLLYSPTEPFPSIQAQIAAPEGMNYHSFGLAAGPAVISPDGSMLVFAATTPEGSTALFLKKLRESEATRIAGTEYAAYPFWSYDSRSIGFISFNGKMKKVDIIGNPPTSIADAFNGLRGSWSSKDVILYSTPRGPLHMVPATGGTPVPVTQLDTVSNETSHRWPFFLPDGEHFLYFSRKVSYAAEAEGDAIMAASLDGGAPTFVVQSSSNAIYASGYLLFMRGGTLLAQKFDENSLSVSGEPIPVREGIINDAGFNLGVFSASQNGILTYQTGFGVAGARMAILDRKGAVLRYVGEIAEHYNPVIAPDQRRILVDIFEPRSRTQNLWIHDLSRKGASRLTSGPSIDLWPVWSPDGKKFVYTAIRTGRMDLYLRTLSGRESDELLYESTSVVYATDWSPDGSTLTLGLHEAADRADIMLIDLEGDRTPAAYIASSFLEASASFSPDGRWITYSSNETGQNEIYVRPFPGPGIPTKVSLSGGYQPHWSHSGREIFFIGSDNAFMSAAVRTTRSDISIGSVTKLFDRPQIMNEQYDVFRDDKRFLMNRTIEPAETDPLTIIVNWTKTIEE